MTLASQRVSIPASSLRRSKEPAGEAISWQIQPITPSRSGSRRSRTETLTPHRSSGGVISRTWSGSRTPAAQFGLRCGGQEDAALALLIAFAEVPLGSLPAVRRSQRPVAAAGRDHGARGAGPGPARTAADAAEAGVLGTPDLVDRDREDGGMAPLAGAVTRDRRDGYR